MRFGFAAAMILSVAVVAGLIYLNSKDGPTNDSKEPLRFYCAAGVYKAVNKVAEQYTKEYGVPIETVPGGSGKLLAEIKVKGDGHVYLTADETYIAKGRKDGLIAEALPVAKWYPVLALAKGNPAGVKTIEDLLRPEVRLIIANPESASIGRTVRAALETTGQWKKIAAKKGVTYVGTVPDVANQLYLGAADAGFLWTVTAISKGLEYIETEALTAAKQTIYVGILTGHDRPRDALRFARYLTSRDKAMPTFKAEHYEPIEDADEWEGPEPDITIYAGTMLKPGIEAAIERFEAREGVRINTGYHGCGELVAKMNAQIRTNGKLLPEVYVSCDSTFMKLVQSHFEPSVDLSQNKMVIVVRKGNPHGIQSLQDLAKPGLRIGFTDPEKSALGALTHRLLKKSSALDENGKPKRDENGDIVTLLAEVKRVNVPSTFASGHALIVQARLALDAAIAYKSNVLSDEDNIKYLDFIEIPLPEAIATQPFAVSKNAKHRYLMYRLLDAITTAETAQRFEDVGFNWTYEKDQP